MTGYNTQGTQTFPNAVQPNDIKALISKNGRAVLGNQEVTLKTPQLADPKLQAIVNNPAFSVKPINIGSGHAEFELSAAGQSVRISLDAKPTH